MASATTKTEGGVSVSPHIAMITVAGMAILNPTLRLTAMLMKRNCTVTLITTKSFVSDAEANVVSYFLKAYPAVRHVEFEPVSSEISGHDAFHLQYHAISFSAHLLGPLLSSVRPSAVVCDLLVCKGIATIAKELSIPCYVSNISTARFICFALHLPFLISNRDKLELDGNAKEVDIPGLSRVRGSSIRTHFLSTNHPFASVLLSIPEGLEKASGMMINTFDWLEPEAMNSLNNGTVSTKLPPVYAIGPLETYPLSPDQTQCLPWLDQQPANSVVYINFGSRTAMSFEQIMELRDGLELSGHMFLWTLKTAVVDREDKKDLKTLLGELFLEGTKERGMVVKWVNQQDVLSHPSIAGFISHCGANSVMEAAENGVPILAWPADGDHMLNAEVAEYSGLAMYDPTWGLGPGHRLVKADEIANKIKDLVEDPVLRSRAKNVKVEANKAIAFGGTSHDGLTAIINRLTA